MRLHILHNPLSLESRGSWIHQDSRKPPSFAADSKVASVVVVGKPAIAPVRKRLLKSSMSNFFFSAQNTISDFLNFTVVIIKLTIIRLVISCLLVSSLKVCTLDFPFLRRSCIPQFINMDFFSISECTSMFVLFGVGVCDLVASAVQCLMSYSIGNVSM